MLESNRRKSKVIERITLCVILIILLIFISVMVNTVNHLQGTARVINRAGLVRGATQQLVKLEIVDQPQDKMIQNIDDLINNLLFGNQDLEIARLNDRHYLSELSKQYEYWKVLKEEILVAREKGYRNTNLIEYSEQYFVLADNTVSASEEYSQSLATKLRYLEYILIAFIIILVVYLMAQVVSSVHLVKRNKELKEKAYVDLHTGLPNKSRCNELLDNDNAISVQTCFVMFDLNFLKKVNDTLGHVAGDTLIQNFANILRKTIVARAFVGRFGGDEFIVIIENCDEQEINKILDDIAIAVSRYNSFGYQIPMSYACGYAMSEDYPDCTLQELLEKADINMYINKQAYHIEEYE